GGGEGKGLACVLRAADSAPRPARIALTGTEDLRKIADRHAGVPRPQGPWQPALPKRLEMREVSGGDEAGAVVLGLADEPQRQRRSAVRLAPGRDRGLVVIGGAGSGKSTVARLIAEQCENAIVVPRDAEAAWDALERAAAASGTTV